MHKVKTHWEVRRPLFRRLPGPTVEQFCDEPTARLKAMEHALRGQDGTHTGEVQLVEVETYEALREVFTQAGTKARLTGPADGSAR